MTAMERTPMMPAIPPDVPRHELPEFLCRNCAGAEPAELEMLEDAPCRHCGAVVTIDDRLEHARNVLGTLFRHGHHDVVVRVVG